MKDLSIKQIATEVFHIDFGLQAYEHLFPNASVWARDAMNLIGVLPNVSTLSKSMIIPSNGIIDLPEDMVMLMDVALETHDNTIVYPSFAEGLSQKIHSVGPSKTGNVPTGNATSYSPHRGQTISSARADVQLGTDGQNIFFTMGDSSKYRCVIVSYTGLRRDDNLDLIIPKLAVPAVKAYIEWKYTASRRYEKMQSVRRTDPASAEERFHRLAGDARGKMNTPSLSSLKAGAHLQNYNFIRGPKIR